MARRATITKSERANQTNVLLLDAGDSLLNDRYPAKSSQGASSIAAMNLLQYDAMTLGSLDLTLLSVDDLRARMAEAAFPIVAANVSIGATGEALTEPYAVLERWGHRIAILGLTDPAELDGWSIAEPLATAQQWVPEMRRKADIIIVLSHAGVETDQTIADSVPGIDVIISGRGAAQDRYESSQMGTLVFHADSPSPGQAGRAVGIARLHFDRAGRMVGYEWRKVVLGNDVESDAETEVWILKNDPLFR